MFQFMARRPKAPEPQTLQTAISEFEFKFFASIADSGIEGRLPFVSLWNGHTLFGYSFDGGYYEATFASHRAEFEQLNLRWEARAAAFDALISYWHENAYPILRSTYCRPNSVVMDIGCRGCHFAVKASPLVGSSGMVICVDPTEFAERYFILHRDANHLDNCRFVRAAVDEKPGARTFYSGSTGESYSGFLQQTSGMDGKPVIQPHLHDRSETIEATTIDRIASGLQLHRLDVIMLQINGMEHKALCGAAGVLKEFKPIVYTVAAMNGADPGKRIDELTCSLLSQAGYRRALRTGGGADVYLPQA